MQEAEDRRVVWLCDNGREDEPLKRRDVRMVAQGVLHKLRE